MKTCDDCQRMKPMPKFITALSRSLKGLFEVFSIPYRGGPRFLLVCVEHLTNWPIVRARKDATAQTVINFMEEEVFHTCGIPSVILSDNADCFTARSLVAFMKKMAVKWKPVAAYAPMSNGKPERMVGTIKKATGRLVLDNPQYWHKHCNKAVHGYRRRPFSR